MKNVMTRAWEIAKEAVVNFGGEAIEYIAESLRMAWAETKQSDNKKIKFEEKGLDIELNAEDESIIVNGGPFTNLKARLVDVDGTYGEINREVAQAVKGQGKRYALIGSSKFVVIPVTNEIKREAEAFFAPYKKEVKKVKQNGWVNQVEESLMREDLGYGYESQF